jgi:hypothetical protein
MSVSGGVFNIIQQAQVNSISVRYAATTTTTSSSGGGSTNPLTWPLRKNESAIQSFWRLAPEEAAKRAPSVDLVKRLEKLADGDNKDISAEKLRQAKAKLSALRQQLQMAAAHGDPRQMKRLAAEAARLAREVGAAARELSQSVASGTGTYSAQGSSETAGESSGLQAQIALGAGRDQAFKALHDIGSDARTAIAQAKGLIALAAQMARARRKAQDNDDDNFFRRLQEMTDAALADVDAGQRAALGEMFLPADLGGGAMVETIVSQQISVEISLTSHSGLTTILV